MFTSFGIRPSLFTRLFALLFPLFLVLLLAVSCAEREHAPPPAGYTPTDTGEKSTDTTTDTDDDSGTSSDPEAGEPDLADAVIIHPALKVTECARVDQGDGDHPSLFAIGGEWFAFYTEGGEYSSPLEVRTSKIDSLSFGDPTTLLHGAREVDLILDDGRLTALAARQFYAVLLVSDDSSEWTELGNIAPDEPTYNCDGFPPAMFFRSSGSPRFIAMGNDYNTGIFGCTDRLFVAKKTADTWNVPIHSGKGDVVFAYQGSNQLTVVTTFGIYVSTDDGGTFSELKDGDTTASQLKGTGATSTDSRLNLIQTYDWANEYSIALVISDDEGTSWNERIILQKSNSPYFAPLIASDENRLAVAWIVSGAVWAMTSPDAGDTWSEPGRLTDPTSETGGASKLSIAVSGSHIGVLFAGEGIHACLAS